MQQISPIILLLLVMVGYLIYKVHRLEGLLSGRPKVGVRTSRRQSGKVIPILKEDLEPGPFQSNDRRGRFERKKDPESE
jgi:hypothetical protein